MWDTDRDICKYCLGTKYELESSLIFPCYCKDGVCEICFETHLSYRKSNKCEICLQEYRNYSFNLHIDPVKWLIENSSFSIKKSKNLFLLLTYLVIVNTTFLSPVVYLLDSTFSMVSELIG